MRSIIFILGMLVFGSTVKGEDIIPWGIVCTPRIDEHGWPDSIASYNHAKALADTMKNAGIKWVRMDFNWEGFQPYDSAKSDSLYSISDPALQPFLWKGTDIKLQPLIEDSLSVLGLLAYCPVWAMSIHPDTVAKYYESQYANHALYSPASVNQWKTFVCSTVTHYKDKVKYWEIWNEDKNEEIT